MKEILLAILLVLVTSLFTSAQITISGYVEDAGSGEALISANVYEVKRLQGTVTNSYGFFSLSLPADSIHLKVSYVGYEPFDTVFIATSNVQLKVQLGLVTELKEVVVRSSSQGEVIQQKSQMSEVHIPMSQIKSLPAFMGEVDILKALQLMPGVQSGVEGSSGLYVRGGSPDQNLILLDGVPVYNASHLLGFFSVFNPEAINSVSLIKGGFPARYGGRLSSVIDVRMKEGSNKKWGGGYSIGLLSSKFMIEGPIVKDRSSFMIAFRRTYYDLLARAVARISTGEKLPLTAYFYDLNAKFNYKISDKDRLFISFYSGDDRFKNSVTNSNTFSDYKDEFSFSGGWGNITAVGRWNHTFNPKLFGNLTLAFSKFKLDTGIEEKIEYTPPDETPVKETYRFEYFSGIRDWSLKTNFDFLPNPNHFIRFGGQATWHAFDPSAFQLQTSLTGNEPVDTLLNASEVDAASFELFAEDDWKISGRLKANAGIHLSAFKVENNFYTSIQPRLSMRYLLNENISLKASYAEMTQYIHLLTNSFINLPTDLWVPSTDKVKPQRSRQVALGYAQTFNNKFEFSVEGYYKTMNNIIEYEEGASYLSGVFNNTWDEKIESGTGRAYGLELLLQKKEGRLTGWLGYTLAWSNRQFENINFGERFAYKYDRRHDLSIATVYKLSKGIEISGAWVFSTGNALTLAIAQFGLPNSNGGNRIFDYFGGRNAFRVGSYHRLDFGINFIKKKKRGTRTWNISVYNTYNQKNPFFVYAEENYITGQRTFKQVTLLPIVPSFSYTRNF